MAISPFAPSSSAGEELRVVQHVAEGNARTTIMQTARDIPIVAETDVVVVGGGVAGANAALAAAGQKLSVMLLEQRNYFGCEFTGPLLTESPAFQAVDGFPLTDDFFRGWGREVQSGNRLNPRRLQRVLHEAIVAERLVQPLLYTICNGVVMSGERVCGVVVFNRSGSQIILAKSVVDATADARVSIAAGAELSDQKKGDAVARRTIRLHCDVSLSTGMLKVPGEIGLLNDQVLVRRDGGCTLEYAFTVGSRDASRAQVDSWTRGKAVLDYLDASSDAISKERPPHRWFSFAPEVAVSRRPMVRCEVELPKEPFELRALLADEVYVPRGVEGLAVTGQLLSSSLALEGLQALLCAGEQAGRVAASKAKANSFPKVLPRPEPRKSSAPTAPTVREILPAGDSGSTCPKLTQRAVELPVIDQIDVVVVGGGTSGAPAAIAAARQGARVALVEMLPNLGGTGSNRVNGYYWGVPWRSRLTAELDSHTALQQRQREKIRFDGESKKIALQQLALEAGVRIYYQALGTGVVMEGTAVRGVVVEGAGGRGVILAKTTIDATGHGDLAAAAGGRVMKGRRSDGFMNEIAGRGLRDATDAGDVSQFLMDHPPSNVALNPRESRRMEGDYVLTFEDAVHGRTFPDTVCYWRSNYDTHLPTAAGMSDAAQDWVGIMGLWRYPLVSAIPYRCLLPQGVDYLLVAAKSYSIDHDAHICGRMQSDLQHLGEVAGVAAAMAVREGVAPRELEVSWLQDELTRTGVLPADREPLQEASLRLAEAVEELGEGDGHTDADPDLPREFGGPLREAESDGSPIPDAMKRLYLGGDASIPLLRPLLRSSTPAVRTDAALVLGMLGDRAAADELLRVLETRDSRTHAFQLEGCSWRPSLPAYQSSVILLGRLREKRAVPELIELVGNPETCSPYLASFVIVALGRIGEPDAAEAIRSYLRLLDHRSAEERKQVAEASRKNETNTFEILYGTPTHAARALAQLGDLSGVPILAEFLDSKLALVRDYAQQLLEEITGQRLGRDRETWLDWWKKNPS